MNGMISRLRWHWKYRRSDLGRDLDCAPASQLLASDTAVAAGRRRAPTVGRIEVGYSAGLDAGIGNAADIP